MKSHLAVNALRKAVATHGIAAGCVIDTDRGSQFWSRKFVRESTIVGWWDPWATSACPDNAATESFFALLRRTCSTALLSWATREEPRIAIVIWIERTYHRRRQHRLGRLTPVEFESIMTAPAALAA